MVADDALMPRWASRKSAASPDRATAGRVLVIGCGALARELVGLVRDLGLDHVDVTCLPASLHNRPELIPSAIRARIQAARAGQRGPAYGQIFVAYADCGTGGLLDLVLNEERVERLGGAHCYEVYAGRAAFALLSSQEPGTFYLTDFLVRNFNRLVITGLGLDRHPELLPLYFGNYLRVVYLAQTDDPALTATAEQAATRLGLVFERRYVGLGELAPAIAAFSATPAAADAAHAGQALSPVSFAPYARNGHPEDPVVGFPVESLREIQRSDPRTNESVESLRAKQRTDAAPRRTVAYVHPMQGAARKLRRMQHPDRLSQAGTPSGATSVRSAGLLATEAH
jgi:hypothetical protein